ncbi:DUF3616 domain-containing protein [Egbenema bharatensis]|uniref:DUF3616 domain-containing protein n=1 Tax=Egbenema bharatensis TaxID=3463334 RepID=UPI003A848A12
MTSGYLLNRVFLQFDHETLHHDLSAVVFAEDCLWLGSDEENSIERLVQLDACTFGQHECFQFADLFDDFDDADGEVDVEGMAYDGSYLWIIGSHSTKRKKIKPDKVERLTTVKVEPNRYFLARVPLADKELHQSYNDLTAAYLEKNKDGNVLMSALKTDEYFAPFLAEVSVNHPAMPGKDNGFDIEGLAVQDGRLLIGLREPVLRGIAVMLEIEVEEVAPGQLTLKPIGSNGQPFKKHFLDLEGFGIRDLRRWNEELLILAGPTMDLDGTITLYSLKDPFDLEDNSLTVPGKHLKPIFDIPHGDRTDRAEGITPLPVMNRTDTLLVVYDSPAAERLIDQTGVLADVFTLE